LGVAIPNAHLSPRGDYDLIHCAHCLSKNKNKPWVADLEGVWSMGLSGNKTKRGRKKIKKILLAENCKKILPWTDFTKKEILSVYPEVKNKVELVYPAIPEVKNLKKKKKKKLRIIFVARYFEIKGGLIALEVMEKLRKKYGTEGVVVSDVPRDLKKKYPDLKIYNLIPQNKLFELLAEADIFLYPSFHDTFGFSLLEAMAFGLPIVTVHNGKFTPSREEIVENGKTGFLFETNGSFSLNKIGIKEKKIVGSLIQNAAKLILNANLRMKMSQNCLEEIRQGKFSIRERNKKLKRIYEEAVE